ncbi:MAG: methylenetetrahydrofolate reductase [NAD(P)H] [Desulfuromonas sp.]|jgi:methylenetetrahydrofolate reductase (NADPH)|uniref:methylenetetrahydrofolate reductase [NAD(P)H] n=1 Tax=Desulfuromonas thiophila TaxID=57664 RepID=UPI0029F52685|nr:methylenetetrahydrofolate reductase [NAD(P)H] [Desulfuromonas thiophila]MCK9173172.1 methylenetetrahydrofolate reductase [NAD(P)H] [Desulfuromonas thiophila]MDY0397672.1 methylenetetrahydrofolate reductase [NAD(P)H] [Desulfuromonas thiophila]
MLMKQILDRQQPSLSFEFFPPQTPAGWQALEQEIAALVPLQPTSVSITYGAGGSTRDQTHELVLRIQRQTGITVVPHQTCVAASRQEVREILTRYQNEGIENLLALRGDPPRDQPNWQPPADGFVRAADLVRFVRQEFPTMSIGVAGFPEGHPATPNRLLEMEYLRQKVAAGADYIVTQLFFDNRDFYDFCERCELAGIRVPVLAGIMPLRSRKSMERLAELAAGARFPAALLRRLAAAADDGEVERIGIDWATAQVADLLGQGVRGVHFYTLNSAAATREIFRRLGLPAARQGE